MVGSGRSHFNKWKNESALICVKNKITCMPVCASMHDGSVCCIVCLSAFSLSISVDVCVRMYTCMPALWRGWKSWD